MSSCWRMGVQVKNVKILWKIFQKILIPFSVLRLSSCGFTLRLRLRSARRPQGGVWGGGGGIKKQISSYPFFFVYIGRIFYSFRKYIYLNCLSMKQLDFFIWTVFLWNNSIFLEKINVKTGLKMEFCPKSTPFFTNFLAICAWPFFFCRFWPIFLFLQRICFFELSFYETIWFFLKKCQNESKNGVLLPPPKKLKKMFVFFF